MAKNGPTKCVYCGKPIIQSGRGGTARKYCLDEPGVYCRRKASQFHPERHNKKIYACQMCGKEKLLWAAQRKLRMENYYCIKCQDLLRLTLIVEGFKYCGKCGELKPMTNFSKYKGNISGLDSLCSNCKSENMKQWNAKPSVKRKRTIYRQRPEAKEYDAVYRTTPEFKKRRCELEKKKAQEDVGWRLHQRISTLVRHDIRCNKNGKTLESILGYRIVTLRCHLENQFQKGMDWNNYGEWEIDHIIPRSVFNFNHPNNIDFKRCWDLSNLRPLWKRENMSKGAKLEKPFQPALGLKCQDHHQSQPS